MGTFSVISPAIHVHDLDVGPFLEQFAMHVEVATPDVTTFGSGGWHTRTPGLKTVASDGTGFTDFSATGSDLSLWNQLAAVDQVATICAQGAETNVAYFWQAGRFMFTPLDAKVGDASGFKTSSQSTNKQGAIRGQLGKAKGTVSATGQLGSALNLGAASSSQFLYASFHIFVAATTITIQIQSDTANNFPAPTTRATIGPLTATGGTFLTRVAGPITDTWWRFNVSAITGTFTVAGAIGVQ